jgi:hypothetical protein
MVPEDDCPGASCDGACAEIKPDVKASQNIDTPKKDTVRRILTVIV